MQKVIIKKDSKLSDVLEDMSKLFSYKETTENSITVFTMDIMMPEMTEMTASFSTAPMTRSTENIGAEIGIKTEKIDINLEHSIETNIHKYLINMFSELKTNDSKIMLNIEKLDIKLSLAESMFATISRRIRPNTIITSPTVYDKFFKNIDKYNYLLIEDFDKILMYGESNELNDPGIKLIVNKQDNIFNLLFIGLNSSRSLMNVTE
jgi:hypothetical protein